MSHLNLQVVGIDLSLTSTGLVGTSNDRITHMHNIKTTGKKDDTLEQRSARIFGIANEVVDWIHGDGCDLVVIEGPSFGSKFGHAHDRSGLWWLVMTALIEDGYPVAQVSPQGRAKYGTGAGGSKKDVVLAHVKERYQGLVDFTIPNDDVADAILLAAMGARRLGVPVEPADLPASNLAAMDGVLWPSV